MGVIQRELFKTLRSTPKLLLEKFISNKLDKYGINDKKLCATLADRMLSGDFSEFTWDADVEPDKNIEFTEEDRIDFDKIIENFLSKEIAEIVSDLTSEAAIDIVKGLLARWPEVKISENADSYHFCQRLDLRWAKGIDPLKMLHIASREIGERYAERLRKTKAQKGISRRQVTFLLHARACQTTLEILTLAEHGLADGAFARWRTLYEIAVVAFVIDRFGDSIAEKYLEHDIVSTKELVDIERRYNPQAYSKKFVHAVQENFNYVIEKYGSSFSSPYGWAITETDRKRPTFQDIEKLVDWGSLSPNYKLSSQKVHAGAAGLLNSISMIGDNLQIASGATNAGLEVPIVNTAYTLTQITSLLYTGRKTIDDQIEMLSLCSLRDQAERECRKAAQQLHRDELQLKERRHPNLHSSVEPQ